MARYYLKPIFWNTNNYCGPSGVRATSGYPAKHGFGHEEWNNADFMRFDERGQEFRAFYIADLGNTQCTDFDEPIFVFLYASHDGLQQLVGIAGNATCTSKREQRTRARELGLSRLWKATWQLESVKDLYADEAAFKQFWKNNVHANVRWKCPADLFFWPDIPVNLDARRITGKQRLTNRFSSYHQIDPVTAINLLETLPNPARTDAWGRIHAEVERGFDDPMSDIADIKANNTSTTTKQALVDARVGQGAFRRGLMVRWGAACAVTGCNQPEILRASHMKPWQSSKNDERLNPRNGLLLSANLDALFDRGLISFGNDGKVIVSAQVAVNTREMLRLEESRLLKALDEMERDFLAFHRNNIFRH